MPLRHLTRASAVSVLAALLAVMAGCGAQPAAAPRPAARVTVAARMVVPPCAGLAPRPVPLRMIVLLAGRRRLRVDTGRRGDTAVHVPPGRYVVAPLRPSLRHSVTSIHLDDRAVPATHGMHVVDLAGGMHRILLLVAQHPLECNGL
jgi:hypothetical protein